MRGRGGFIGANVTPASAALNSAASGVWTVREAEAMRRAGTWPRAPTVPGTPTALSGSAGNAQVTLSWTAPADTGGIAITDYTVQYSSDSGSTWTAFSRAASATASATVTGLTNGTAYVFRVAAVNAVGAGAYTAASGSVTPGSAPPITVSVATTGSGTQVDPFVLGANVQSCSITAAVAGTLYFTSSLAACIDCGDNYGDYLFYVNSQVQQQFRARAGIYSAKTLSAAQTVGLVRADNVSSSGARTSIYFIPS